MSIDRKFTFRATAIGSGNIYSEADALVFLAKDRAFLATLPEYRRQCELLGADANQLRAADLLIERVAAFQRTHETKVPDVNPATEASALER